MAQKVGASQFTAVGCPPDLAARLSDPQKVGRLFDGHIIALFGKFAALYQKDGALFMQMIGPVSAAIASGNWMPVITMITSGQLSSDVWQIIQDIESVLPPAPVVPAPSAA